MSRSLGIAYLDEPAGIFTEMVEGWVRQQRSRNLSQETITYRVATIGRFRDYVGTYPWEWNPEDLEAFTSSLMSGSRPRAKSTVRAIHVTIRAFCEYVSDGRYPWVAECAKRFDLVPSQICFDWNTFEHLADFEGRPGRRGFDYEELQLLFDAADARAERAASLGRKGSLSAFRDAQLLKTAYAFGLRRGEVLGLALHDLRHHPNLPEYGRYGQLQVRFGKASSGGPPRRRTVAALPQFEWAVLALRQWVEEVRPLYDVPDGEQAIWVGERRRGISPRTLENSFNVVRRDAGLSAELTLHSLRHSYVTHLIEYGYSHRFVQDQVGHTFASTTAIYTSVSDEYRHGVVRAALANYYEMGAE